MTYEYEEKIKQCDLRAAAAGRKSCRGERGSKMRRTRRERRGCTIQS